MRVLYVDDDRINALLFEHACSAVEGLQLRCAEDCAPALQVAGEWQPQLLVLDHHLPTSTGIELLDAMRKLPGLADTPAVLCSADCDADLCQRAQSAGFVASWRKPVLAADLKAALAALPVASQA